MEKEDVFGYDGGTWKDRLVAYNYYMMTYDEVGNPLHYHDGREFTWEQGRRLASIKEGNYTLLHMSMIRKASERRKR